MSYQTSKNISRSSLAAAVAAAAALALAGCPNPGVIGVQKFGDIAVQCVQAPNQPVADALVAVSEFTGRTDRDGRFTFTHIAIGSYTVEAHSAGLQGKQDNVLVKENETSRVTIQMAP